MIVQLINGEALKGRIEWYDERCIKLKDDNEANYIVYKHVIKYMYKNPEAVDEENQEEDGPEK